MRYRILGGTGLKVSVIGIGTWQFGGEWGRSYSQAEVDAILDKAADWASTSSILPSVTGSIFPSG